MMTTTIATKTMTPKTMAMISFVLMTLSAATWKNTVPFAVVALTLTPHGSPVVMFDPTIDQSQSV